MMRNVSSHTGLLAERYAAAWARTCLLRAATFTIAVTSFVLGCADHRTEAPTVSRKKNEATETHSAMNSGWKENVMLEARINGAEVPLSPESHEAMIETTLGFFRSCTERSRQRVVAEDWKRAWAAGDCIRIRFSEARVLKSPARPNTRVTDVLVPLGNGGRGTQEVWVRDGDAYYSPFIACDDEKRSELEDTLRLMINDNAKNLPSS